MCDPHVIIVSVKDIRLNAEKEKSGFERWKRKAVEASIKQIYGADRWLTDKTNVVRKDGSSGLDLPPSASRKIHRIAVAFGSDGQVPLASGNFGKGYVHVMHERSFFELLSELDTIADLVQYFTAKEGFSAKCSVVFEGSEANLLGFYLLNERSFPAASDFVHIDDTIWDGLRREPAFIRRKEADAPSYAWDNLIDFLSDPKSKPVSGPDPTINELDIALREMARETRFHRRILGSSVLEFLELAKAKKVRSRIMMSTSGILYVIVYFPPEAQPEIRKVELFTRCVAARKRIGHGEVAIGIGIGEFKPGFGSTSDLIYMRPNWEEIISSGEEILAESKYFEKADLRRSRADEYPAA